MHVWSDIYLKDPIKRNVDVKYGTTVLVFRSNSWSSVRDANLATRMCLKTPESSSRPATRKNSSSHALALFTKSTQCNDKKQ